MTPAVAVSQSDSLEIAQPNAKPDEMLAALTEMLNGTFGDGNWAVNEDSRFATELHVRPIDIFAPLDQQERALDLMAKVTEEFSRRFNALIYLTLVPPPDPTLR